MPNGMQMLGFVHDYCLLTQGQVHSGSMAFGNILSLYSPEPERHHLEGNNNSVKQTWSQITGSLKLNSLLLPLLLLILIPNEMAS